MWRGPVPGRAPPGFSDRGRWADSIGGPVPPFAPSLLAQEPHRFFYNLQLDGEVADDPLEFIGGLARGIALGHGFLLGVALVQQGIGGIGVTSPGASGGPSIWRRRSVGRPPPA